MPGIVSLGKLSRQAGKCEISLSAEGVLSVFLWGFL